MSSSVKVKINKIYTVPQFAEKLMDVQQVSRRSQWLVNLSRIKVSGMVNLKLQVFYINAFPEMSTHTSS